MAHAAPGTRSRPERLKLLLVLLVALLLTAALFVALAQQRAREPQRRSALAHAQQARQADALWNITDRMEDVRLAALLGPEVLGTPAGMAAVRAAIARHRTLLAERRMLLERFVEESQKQAAALPPGSGDAPAALRRRADTVAAVYHELERRQAEVVRTAEAVLDWHDRHPGVAAPRDGRSAAADPGLQDALRRLRHDVIAADAEVRRVIEQMVRLDIAPRPAVRASEPARGW